MTLHLPRRAWIVRLRDGLHEDEPDSPISHLLGEDADIDEERCLGPDILLDGCFNAFSLERDDRVVVFREVYWLNDVTLPNEPPAALASPERAGRPFSQCMGSGVCYDGYDDALRALARRSAVVRLLLAIAAEAGPASDLATACLCGRAEQLEPLATRLEQQGHPHAGEVRALVGRLAFVDGKPTAEADAALRAVVAEGEFEE